MNEYNDRSRLALDPDSMPFIPAARESGSAQGEVRREEQPHRHRGCLPQPYPPAVAQAPNPQYARLIRMAYCGAGCSELGAVMQYFYHSMALQGCAPQAAGEILSIAICEMHHLELLGSLLCSLGSPPKFFAPRRTAHGMQNEWWKAQPSAIAYADELGAALRADIASEEQAIADYRCIIREIADPGIVCLIERILLDEEQHLRIFTALLQRLCG